MRTPPEVSLYHRHGNPLFADVLERLGRDETVHAVVLPRTAEQRGAIRALGLPSLHVPEHAVDAQSLIALADLVVSAGGTMNREAVALGTPVYTTFAGRLGAVDETLIRRGAAAPAHRRRRARRAQARPRAERVRRDPRPLLDLLLGAGSDVRGGEIGTHQTFTFQGDEGGYCMKASRRALTVLALAATAAVLTAGAIAGDNSDSTASRRHSRR